MVQTMLSKRGSATKMCQQYHKYYVMSYLLFKIDQILVAIQMSTQAQPSVVQAALQKVEANYGQITPESVQNIEYENLKDTINNVHRNKQKAKFIKEGACILLDKFNGCMPTDKKDLMAFPGIGPELGALLAALFAAGVGS
eukprot:m.186332 g.186332  ORF g.186332 m.186332 type:complete len:141 (+) comp15590_c0_seq8:1013-1435(+)